ncbi:unnamed protein product, partial [marine sediment metagenome]
TTYNTVHVDFVNPDGVWVLSEGCKVSNVRIEAESDGIGVFGIGTTLTSSGDDVTIEGCVFDCGAYFTSSYFIKLCEVAFAGASISNLIVKDNNVTAGTSFIAYGSVGYDFFNFNICNNVVEITDVAAATYAIILWANTTGTGIMISNNTFIGPFGVYLRNFTGCDVSHNAFVLGVANVATSVFGISAHTVTKSIISYNTFRERTGNTAVDLTGIRTQALTDFNISHNTIKEVQQGIYDAASTASSYVTIASNIIEAIDNGAGAGGVGIFTYCNNLIISNNQIYA